MLDEKYFAELGQPPVARMNRLPLWAIRYERDLRSLAKWWHEAAKHRPEWGCPVPIEPASDRLSALPVWMVDWIYTLRFEVWWQRHQVQPSEPPNLLNRPSTNSPTFRKGLFA